MTFPAGSAAAAFVLAALAAAPAPAADVSPAEVPADLVAPVHAMRRVFAGGEPPPAEDSWQRIELRGRPSLEVKGRVPGPAGTAQLRDVAVVDLATGRIASFVWFPGASRRRAGEAIQPMSEAATAADARVGALVPGTPLAFVGVQRYRASGEESVYYEVGYAPEGGEVRYPDPPVRLLLDASSGALFRFDVDAGWYDPLPPPARRLSPAVAVRIASVLLRPPALEGAFGAGARPTRIAAEGLYFVRPNGWPGGAGGDAEEPRRLAWGVSFAVEGTGRPAQGVLYVDATTGRSLGGAPGTPP